MLLFHIIITLDKDKFITNFSLNIFNPLNDLNYLTLTL